MKNAEEFMEDFMRTWKNMLKYQDIKLNPIQPNYDDFEKAFAEEIILKEFTEIESDIMSKELITTQMKVKDNLVGVL